jgi:hypothetical protein
MDNELFCKCGKEATKFTTDTGWLCLECLDKKLDEAITKEDIYDQAYILLSLDY